ncbi:MAG: PAS domain S-box protein [Sporomusaceae bacterium]|nr:PAS domain S-box protein [Sporomusaceae bacterium]
MELDLRSIKINELIACKDLDFWIMFDLVPIPIFVKDYCGTYTGCNKAYESFIGLSKNEVIGKSAYDLLPKEYADLYHFKDQELFEKEEVQVYENSFSVDGKARHVVFHKMLYRDMFGVVQGLVGAVIDVTEKKEAEKALRISEEKNKVLIQTIPDIMLVVTPELTIVEFKQASEFSHIGDKTILGKQIQDILPAHAAHIFKENVELSFQQKKVRPFEYQIEYEDGMKYREARAVVISGEQALIMIRDITEQKLAQEEILKLSQAVEANPGSIIIIDKEETIIYVNAEYSRISGYSKAEIVGQNVSFFRSEAHPESLYKEIKETVTNGKQWQGEICNKRKNGNLYWVLVSISPVKNADGEISYYLSMELDITEKKVMEDSLYRHNEQLTAAYKALESTQLQMVQQEKLASIGQLAAGVGHEINNPVGFVSSNFNTLQKYFSRIAEVTCKYKELKSIEGIQSCLGVSEFIDQINQLEKRKKLEFILEDIPTLFNECEEGLQRIQDIAKALKLFVRSDRQNEFDAYDLNEGIKNTLIIAKNEVKYVAEVETDLKAVPAFSASSGQINQVLLNLIVNAAHAIAAKQLDAMGKIKISTHHDESFAYCLIQDNGVGMSKDIKEKIFNAFFTTKPVGKGTGLGLSISYDIIVNKHEGVLEVESQEGVGTTFIIKLPLNECLQESV